MIKEDELDLLVATLFEQHGYDFGNYAKASLKEE